MVGNEADDEVVDVGPPPGAADRRRSPAAETSLVHRRRGVRGWSRGKHSWRGWPAPAHSPIRPPPSTQRDKPANYSSIKLSVAETSLC